MKIGLLGAPGAGKSLVAKKLQSILGDQPCGEWKIVDGYVEKLSQRTGISFGEISTFAHNFAVISDRWVRESEVQLQGYNSITCGTIYETIIYATCVTLFRSALEEEMMYNEFYTRSMMGALGGFEKTTYTYDAIFYLPWTDKQIRKAEEDRSWGAVVNAKIPEVLDGFNKYPIPLIGSTATRATEAAQVVRDLYSTYVTQAEQLRNQFNNSDSESTEHRS